MGNLRVDLKVVRLTQWTDMKKWLPYLILAGITATCAFWWFIAGMPLPGWLGTSDDSSLSRNYEQPVRAEFQFSKTLPAREITDLPHLTLRLPLSGNWEMDADSLRTASGGQLLLTVETWGNRQLNTYDSNPLVDMAAGNYDESILRLCRQLPGEGAGITLRLNPDMEVPGSRYPWQQYPSVYLSSFQRFADLVHEHAPRATVMWAPAGYPGAMEYYPGDGYVDAGSVTIRDRTEDGLDAYPVYEDLEYDLFRRLHRLRFINVPILVLAEGTGVADSLDHALIARVAARIAANRALAYQAENFVRTDSSRQTGSRDADMIMGLHDPMELLLDDPGVTVEHLFVDFRSMRNGQFPKALGEVAARNHDVIVTFEPFYLPDGSTDTDVLRHVTAGEYDDYIREFYTMIAETDRKIYLRYAHEMEIPIHRYPWQSQDPVEYIRSYRYFMAADTVSDNVVHVWGPAGDRGSEEWYPGNDWVDFVSIAIYGLPDKNITDPKKQESFARIYDRKLWRMRFIDKPVFITEFGVKGPEDYQTGWMVDAAKVLREDGRVAGINYFNMSDTPAAWGEIKPPDWSITKPTLDAFLAALREK